MMPHQIDEMTVSEILLCLEVPLPLEGDEGRKSRSWSDDDVREAVEEDRRLGPRGLLERALRKRS